MFNFTPLLGAQSHSSASQSLLELDGGIKILIDVGWDESFDAEQLRNLERQIPTLSIILLTHATPSHLAAFAHCCKNFPLFKRIPVYATNPVVSLGKTLLQDLYASAPAAATFVSSSAVSESTISAKSSILLPAPTAEEIASYFSLIHPLKYSQPHQPLPSPFSPPLNGLTITAYNAGHSLGGTIWHIQLGMESIIYAVDWNQAKENVYAGAAWFGGSGAIGTDVIDQLRKPTALVCSSSGAQRVALSGGRSKRDDLLMDHIRSSVIKGGTVLIPTDTSARVLELMYMLEHELRKASLKNDGDPNLTAKVYFASKTAGATIRYARSMLEWMDERIVQEFETDFSEGTKRPGKPLLGINKSNDANKDKSSGAKEHGPLEFRHLKLIERRSQLEKLLSSEGPKVIVASDTSLEWGFSRTAIGKVVDNPNNLIILTESLEGHRNGQTQNADACPSLAQTLWDWFEERRDGVATEISSDGELLEQVHTGGRDLIIKTVKKLPLEPTEQLLYQQYLATQRQLQATLQDTAAGLESSADAVDEASSSSSSSDEESDSEQQGRALNFASTFTHTNRNKLGLSDEELGVNILLRRKGVYDYDVRRKKGREKMFPFIAKRRRVDEFGELIRPDEYLRAEERDEIDGQDVKNEEGNSENALGQKRKWGNVGMDGQANSKRRRNGRQDRVAGERAGGRALGRHGMDGIDESATASEDDELDASDEETEVEGPAKAIVETMVVSVHSRLAFLDFEGIHDQRSLQMLIPLIQPRKLILIRGTKDETVSLAEDCRKLLAAKSGEPNEIDSVPIFTPSNGEVVDASVDTNAWMVRLTRSLVRNLHWQNVRGLGVVTLTGQLAAARISNERDAENSNTGGSSSINDKKKKQKLIKSENEDGEDGEGDAEQDGQEDRDEAKGNAGKFEAEPILDVLPPSMAAATRSVAQPLHVGDLRLADLRKFLQSSGHTAEFRGEGTLLIDDVVAVRKTATGRIEVEGGNLAASPSASGAKASAEGTFFAVKRKIYEGLAVIAGS